MAAQPPWRESFLSGPNYPTGIKVSDDDCISPISPLPHDAPPQLLQQQLASLPPPSPSISRTSDEQSYGRSTQPISNSQAEASTRLGRGGVDSGQLVWQGVLKSHEVLTIVASNPTIAGERKGSLSAELPGKPVNLSYDNKIIKLLMRPDDANGWKNLAIQNIGSKQTRIVIQWSLKH